MNCNYMYTLSFANIVGRTHLNKKNAFYMPVFVSVVPTFSLRAVARTKRKKCFWAADSVIFYDMVSAGNGLSRKHDFVFKRPVVSIL